MTKDEIKDFMENHKKSNTKNDNELMHCGICKYFLINKGSGHAGTWYECKKDYPENSFIFISNQKEDYRECNGFEKNNNSVNYVDHRVFR